MRAYGNFNSVNGNGGWDSIGVCGYGNHANGGAGWDSVHGHGFNNFTQGGGFQDLCSMGAHHWGMNPFHFNPFC